MCKKYSPRLLILFPPLCVLRIEPELVYSRKVLHPHPRSSEAGSCVYPRLASDVDFPVWYRNYSGVLLPPPLGLRFYEL